MDALAALRLQLEWGADEALGDAPVDRTARRRDRAAVSAIAEAPRPSPAVSGPAFSGPAFSGPALSNEASADPRRDTAVAPLGPRRERNAPPPPAQRAEEIAAACSTRAELRAALATFDGCGLSTTATNLVFADGNPEAGLMLVGESPGVEEDRAGKPFVGPSGQLLDRMLASIGLSRADVLITNLIPWRPPGNRNPTEDEILICLPFLLRHIALVRPQRLVTLGALSTRALLGQSQGIRRMRGRWQNVIIAGMSEALPTLPMYHPAYLLRTSAAKREAWADLRRLSKVIRT